MAMDGDNKYGNNIEHDTKVYTQKRKKKRKKTEICVH